MKCVICQRREAEQPQVCLGDRLWLDRTLAEIVELYAMLPANMVPGQAQGQRVSGSREAPLPLRVDPLDLSMPARTDGIHDDPVQAFETVPVEVEVYLPTDPDAAEYLVMVVPMRQRRIRLDGDGKPVKRPSGDQVGLTSIPSALDSWVREWAETRQMDEWLPEPNVYELVGWLCRRLDWACDHHPAVDEFATEIRRLHGTLRAVVGIKSDRVYVGPCPVTDDKGSCGAALTADPYLDIIRCPRCDTMWPRDKWLWLGMTIRNEVA